MTGICSHQWISPKDAPIARAPYSPVIGDKRREMKPGGHYVCQNCGAVVVVGADVLNRFVPVTVARPSR